MYFLRATRPSTILSICGCINGSPPGIETIGVPHSSTALKHCSGVRFFFSTWAGYWIFPQPAQARLQRKRGSSMSTSGYCLLPRRRCLSTYVATVHIWDIGTPISNLPMQNGRLDGPRDDGGYRKTGAVQIIRVNRPQI